jgi:hypothetical protein
VFGLTDSGEMVLSPSSDEDPAGGYQRINGSQRPQPTDPPDCDEFTRLLTQDDARMLVDLLKLAVAGESCDACDALQGHYLFVEM